MNKKMLFIFNPHSGKGHLKNYLYEIIDIFAKENYIITVHPTQHQNDAYETVKKYAPKFDAVIISGGDGTLNEAVKGMLEHEFSERCPIGYIPSGTTNDFASSRYIPKDIIKASEMIASGSPHPEDIGLLNGISFNYVAAFGAFTDVSYDTPQGIKNVLGPAAYVVEGIKKLPAIDQIHVKLKSDNTEIDDYFSVGVILNSTSMAGIKFEDKYDVQFDDGLFEILLVKMPVTLIQASEILTALIRGEEQSDQFVFIRSSKAEIEFDEEVKWTLDGEYGGSFKTAEMTVLNKAVSFIL